MKDVNSPENQNPSPVSSVPSPVSVQGGTKEAPKGISEFIKPSEQAKALDKEVAEAGVQHVVETPTLDEQHEQIGVRHSSADTPVRTEPTGVVSLPMSDDEAERVMKEYKNKVTVDVGQHGEEQAYIIPSKLGLATLVHKINKVFAFFRRKTA